MMDFLNRALKKEIEQLNQIKVTQPLIQAIELITNCAGKIIISGVGKTHDISHLFAHKLISNNTFAYSLHAGEAGHGSGGAANEHDILIAISNSGRTDEVLQVIEQVRNLGIKIVISICSSKNTPIGAKSDIVIEYGKIQESCPLGLTPTVSTSVINTLTNLIVVGVAYRKGLTAEYYVKAHNSGYLNEKCKKLIQ